MSEPLTTPSSGMVPLPNFAPAGQPELLRARQRDQSQVARLTEITMDVLHSIFGSRQILPNEHLIGLASSLSYYLLTFGLGSQTVGEEYVDILPRSVVSGRSPSRTRRIATLLITILGPHLLRLLTHTLRSRARVRPALDPEAPPSLESRLHRGLEAAQGWVEIASDIHLALFFFRGKFASFGARLGGVTYISTLPPPEDLTERPSYSALGFLLLLPIFHRFVNLLRSSASPLVGGSTAVADKVSRFYLPSTQLPLPSDGGEEVEAQPDGKEKEKVSVDVDLGMQQVEAAAANRKCTLCLEVWTNPAVTPCGHVFCWDCIVGWSGEKAECPLCRQALNPSRLLPLYNM